MLLFAGCCRCHPPRSAPADPRHHASTAPVVAPAPVRGVACFKQPISAGLGGSSGSAAIFHRTLTFRESRVRRGDPAAPGPYELGRSARFRSGRFRILRFGCDPDDRRWQGLTVGASGHYNRQVKNSLSYAVLPCGPCRAIRRPVQSRCPTLLGLRWRRPNLPPGAVSTELVSALHVDLKLWQPGLNQVPLGRSYRINDAFGNAWKVARPRLMPLLTSPSTAEPNVKLRLTCR